MKRFLCHHLNALHVYCRLLEFHVPKIWARRIAGTWERATHPFLYNYR